MNNADHAPEICNEFVTIYRQDNKNLIIDKNSSIDLVRNFCTWLFTEGYTTSKVSMIRN